MKLRSHLVALATIVMTSVAGIGMADESAQQTLADSCAICHGAAGESPGAIPPLSGLSAEEIAARMKAFREGTAEATIMNRLARPFSDAEIEAVSALIAEQNRNRP